MVSQHADFAQSLFLYLSDFVESQSDENKITGSRLNKTTQIVDKFLLLTMYATIGLLVSRPPLSHTVSAKPMTAAQQERMSMQRLTTTLAATSNVAREATSALRLVEVETFRAKSAAAAASNLVGTAIASAAIAGRGGSAAAAAAPVTPDPIRMFLGPNANHSAYVRDGQLFAWGANGSGQLGLGDTTDRFAPTRVPGIWDAVAVGCGADFTVVLRSDGTAFAMGANASGQLGDGTTTARSTPAAVLGVTGATAIAVGAAHVLFLNGATGVVTGYGSDANGQLGDGGTNAVTTALATMTPPTDTTARVTAIAAGANHSFIVLDDGTAFGFGVNANGQLGLGDTAQRTTPAKVPDVANVVGAACGQRHTLLIRSEGQVLAAGDNAAGQLGRGTKSATPVTSFAEALAAPTIPTSTTGNNMRAAGGDVHSVVVRADGTVWAFGGNANGQLGTATMEAERLTATRVAALHGSMSGVGAGATHAVLLRGRDLARPSLGRVFATGLNSSGQVGDVYQDENRRTLLLTNGGNARRFFVPVPEALARKRICASRTGVTAYYRFGYVDVDGTLYTWGSGSENGLGHGDTVNRSIATPVALGSARIVQCSMGANRATALDASGNVVVWGNSFDHFNNSTFPLAMPDMGSLAGRTVVAVAMGGTHTLALDSTGAVHAWGDISYGGNYIGVGDSSNQTRHAPVLINGGTLAGRSVVAIAANITHSLALDTLGDIHAWGGNNSGELGNGTSGMIAFSPVRVQTSGTSTLNGRTVVAIAAGRLSSFAIDTTGAVHAWGNNNGLMGTGSTGSSVLVPGLVSTSRNSSLNGRSVVALSAGVNNVLAIDAMGTVHGWGSSAYGQLAGGNGVSSDLPKVVLSDRTTTYVAAGEVSSLAVDFTGALWSWGQNMHGNLGTNNASNYYLPTEVLLSSRQVHAPIYSRGGIGDHKLMMNRNTSNATLLQVVGANTFGQLGDGSTTSKSAVTSLPLFPTNVVSVDSGLHHSAASLVDGSAYTWGRNHTGQCGPSNVGSNLRAPILLTGMNSSIEAVCCGTHCTFLRLAGGALAALGDNTSNQLGLNAGVAAASNPVLVPGLSNVVDVASGGGVTLAIDTAGRLFTWGTNAFGNTGRGMIDGVTAEPTFVGNHVFQGLRVRRVAVGNGISAAVTEDGSLYTCGLNTEGGLGFSNNFGTSVPVPSFTRIPALSGATHMVVDVVCGPRHMAVQMADNTFRVFGRNNNAQRGVPGGDDWRPCAPFIDRLNTPHRVATTANMVLLESFNRTTRSIGHTIGGTSASMMTGGGTGSTHSAFITSAGELHVWGDNSNGQLGDGTTTRSLVPINISTSGILQGKKMIAVVLGQLQTLALDSSGTLYAWGSNANGQLGDGTKSNTSTPVLVSTAQGSSSLWGRTVVGAVCGSTHTLAVDTTGMLHAWGTGSAGQLGDGFKVERLQPTMISGGSLAGRIVVAVAAGINFSVALDSTGQVHTWGNNSFGQLGNGTTTGERLVPGQLRISGRSIVMIKCGSYHTLALDSTGQVHSWGYNLNGQIGNGGTVNQSSPWNIPNLSLIKSIEASGNTSVALSLGQQNNMRGWGLAGEMLMYGGAANVVSPTSLSQTGTLQSHRMIDVRIAGLHALALDRDGLLHSWGVGSSGQLGTGVTTNTTTPTATVSSRGSLSSASLVSVTTNSGGTKLMNSGIGNTGAIITPYNSLHVWGSDINSPSVPSNSLTPRLRRAGSLTDRIVAAVCTGGLFMLALDSTGAVHAWGSGMLGDGSSSFSSEPLLVSTISGSSLAGRTVTDICAGSQHSLAIDSSGVVHAWGTNTNGALGDSTTTNRQVPVAVTGLSTHVITAIAAGNSCSFALTSLGALYAWGDNTTGMLGDGTTNSRFTPALVNNGTLAGKIVVAIAASTNNVMALDSLGGLHTWDTSRRVPISISTTEGISSLSGRTVVAISVGSGSWFALDSTGAVHAWGRGDQTGTGSTTYRSNPTLVSTLNGSSSLHSRTVVAIGSLGGVATIALDSQGSLHTWGFNGYGQMGDNTTTSPRLFPINTVNTLGTLASVSLAPVNNPTAITFAPFFVNFTGQHRVFLATNQNHTAHEDGFIVVCDRNEYMATDCTGNLTRRRHAIKINEALPIVSVSQNAFDRRVFGVLSSTTQPMSVTESAKQAEQTLACLRELGDTRVQINSVGEGAIWVSDAGLEQGTCLRAGDLVTSSKLPGYGMLQPGGGVQNFTVAKLTCDCDFSAPLEPVQEPRRDPGTGLPLVDPVTGDPLWVTVTRKAYFDGDQEVDGDALEVLGELELEGLRIEHVAVKEPKYDLRYLDAEGKRISHQEYEAAKSEDLAAKVYRAAFLGCTYMCG